MKQKYEIQNIINIIVPPLRKWVPKKYYNPADANEQSEFALRANEVSE